MIGAGENTPTSQPASGTGRPVVTLPPPRSFGAGMLARLGRLTVPAILLAAWQYVSMFVLDETTRALLPAPTAVAAAA